LSRLTLKRLAGEARFGAAPMESVCGDGAPHAGTVEEERVRSVLRFVAEAKSIHKGQPEGVQGAIGKPPGCTGKDKTDAQDISKKEHPGNPSGFPGNGSRVEDPCGVQGRSPCRGVGQSPASRSPEGNALWRGPGAEPLLGCGATPRQRAKPFGHGRVTAVRLSFTM